MMINVEQLEIHIADWSKDQHKLKYIRTKVFIEEQNVPVELEWDDDDAISTHFLATINDEPIATVRLKPDGHIGRMAVLKAMRQHGIGSQLLKTVTQHARDRSLKAVFLNAQVNVVGFYEKYGFESYGEDFFDAGIPHRAMQRKI